MSDSGKTPSTPSATHIRPFVPQPVAMEPPHLGYAPCRLSPAELQSAANFFREASRVLWIGGFPPGITNRAAADMLLNSFPYLESLSALRCFSGHTVKNEAVFAFAVFRTAEDACSVYTRSGGTMAVGAGEQQSVLRLSHSKKIFELAREIQVYKTESGSLQSNMIAELAVDILAIRLNYRLLANATVRQVISFIDKSETSGAFLLALAQSASGGFTRTATGAALGTPPQLLRPECDERRVPASAPRAGPAA